jgi:predicted dehydrogenase
MTDTKRLQIAIIGAGDVAHRHYLPALKSVASRVRLAAVADPRAGAGEALASAAASWSPGATAYGDAGEMLRSESLDGVFDLTPAPLHGQTNRLILDAGVACYSEKPIASTVAEADDLIALAAKSRVPLMCAPGSAVSARIRWLHALIESGSLGKATLAVAHHADPGPADWLEYTGDPTPFYRQGVGPVFDHGVYRLHEMTALLGPVRRVQAMGTIALPTRAIRGGPKTGGTIEVTTPDHVLIQLEFRSGALGQLLASFATADTLAPWLELHLERGVVSFGGKSWEDDAPVSVFDATNGAEEGSWVVARDLPNDDGGVVEEGARHFIRCLLGEERPVLTAEHARHVLEVILAAYASIADSTSHAIETTF